MRLFSVGQEPVGVIAVGQVPTGIVALGQVSTGVVAIGQGARGFIAIGQGALGVFAFGQLALGALWAGGQLAVGGTSSLAMLGYGVLGRFVPWRRGSLEWRPIPSRWAVARRAVLLAVIIVAVALAALFPIADAITEIGGIFRRAPVGPR
jgi:hypothetical protein